MRARGLDLSSCQGAADFAAMKAGGIDFVIEKGTQGAQGVDPTYVARIEAARRAGVLVPLMYHVLTVAAPIDQQVKNACDHADALDLDIALDFEVGGTTLVQALAFSDGCKARGKRVVVYSYPNFIKPFQGSSALALLAQTTAGYWSAYYPGDQKHWPEETAQAWFPSAWKTWLFWQFSGDGGLPAPGVPSVVDHNVFNGTPDDLLKWMAGDKWESFSNPSEESD